MSIDRIHIPDEIFPAADATAPIENSTSTGVPDAIQNACFQFKVRRIVPVDSDTSGAAVNAISDIPPPYIFFFTDPHPDAQDAKTLVRRS